MSKSTSWNETISYMENNKDILCPNLSSILNGKEAGYYNLYALFTEYCNKNDGKINLCGISLCGILALNYTLDFPDKVKSLVLIGTPHKIPKVMFSIQNIVFRFLPKSMFEDMAFNKKDSANIKSAYYFTENIQNAKLKIIENTGHIVNEENPKILAKILSEYYNEIK